MSDTEHAKWRAHKSKSSSINKFKWKRFKTCLMIFNFEAKIQLAL